MTDWEVALTTNYEQLMGYLVAYVPQILGALILLIVGWIIAWIVSRLTHSLVSFVGRLLNKLSSKLSLDKRINIKPHHSVLISRATFWVIMVFFFAAAMSSLGVDFIASWLRELLGYLPNILAGIIIVVGGFFIGNIAKTMTEAAAQTTGLKYSSRIGLFVKWSIVGIAVVIGIEQLGMNIQFVTTLVIVELAVFSFGIALAYGLGSNELVKNLVGSRQAIKHLNVGERVRIAGFEGKIVAFTQSSLELETQTGKVFVPAKLYTETPCVVLAELEHEKDL
ncbi:mechanosensitive ion channel [Aliiglaciecola sp. LCG003]|uniref:mechanosensitive ion channel family protein n=1 Tax=Aliiglaciecola sp. LCG003 TaxID=3053655 RepID=UPI002572AEBF|nr:mechanosensitive ion channel [Aliiglaciecola sp. LCG003]WJG09112.1 mechanosensitive ion channel [Aliiglaciecola sp. LCG003]